MTSRPSGRSLAGSPDPPVAPQRKQVLRRRCILLVVEGREVELRAVVEELEKEEVVPAGQARRRNALACL